MERERHTVDPPPASLSCLVYYVLLILCMQYKKWEEEASTLPLCLRP